MQFQVQQDFWDIFPKKWKPPIISDVTNCRFWNIKMLLIFLEDNLHFLVIFLSLSINFSSLLSTNSLIKLECLSYPISWRNSFQIPCLSCAFLVIPALLLVLLFYKKLKLMNSYLYYGIKTFGRLSFLWEQLINGN